MLLSAHQTLAVEPVYYSIHFATAKSLRDVNSRINRLKEKDKVIFWEKAEVDSDVFYRLYIGRYKTWDEAVASMTRIKNTGVAKHLGVQWFSEVFASEKERIPLELNAAKIPNTLMPTYPGPIDDRFVDHQDGTVTDTRTNLMWVKNGWRLDFLSAETWFDAVDKCREFRHGNYQNWRLPTIEEWRTLIDPRQQNPALVEPNPFVNVISHMPYWSRTEYTYSKDHTCSQKCPLETYTVMLYSGRILHQKKTERAFILPVRSVKTGKAYGKTEMSGLSGMQYVANDSARAQNMLIK